MTIAAPHRPSDGDAPDGGRADAHHAEHHASTSPGPVSEMLKLFARAVRAHQLYLPNNPMHARALDAARQAFAHLWTTCDAVELVVTETHFAHDGEIVLEEQSRGTESLPWLFYKDGIRLLEFRPGFEVDDLRLLLDAMQRVRQRRTEEDDDLLTLLWERDFAAFTYRYVEAADSAAAPGAELLLGGAADGTIEAPMAVETEIPEPINGSVAPSASPFARIDDYDTTLYFLEDREIAYLQDAIRDDFASDLRPSVVAALLDTFEQEDEPAIRDEICGILEQFLLTLLSNMQFGTAAYLLRETSAAVDRSAALLDGQRQRLLELADQMSQPAVLSQLLQALEEIPLASVQQQDLTELFGRLNATALQSVLAHVASTHNAELRTLLEQAATRIAAGHTGELIRLIGHDDHAVALEAIRRAGALRSPAAVAPLSKALGSSTDDVRRAAATALVDVGSAGAMQALERAVEDEDRDVRMIAVRAIAERQHRAALSRVERVLKDRVMGEQHGPEKVAFFEAYASLAGDGCVAMFDAMLNPRGFLTRKEDTQTRACAAVALGKVGSTRALDALRKATSDKDVVVRNAASRALRGLVS